MANIEEAKRIIKRILLSNLLTNDYSISLTPLISGKHGIGKSQIAKQIADDLNGMSITIEGGTLKEGEITGIPYQYKNENGEIEFRFLPYYVVERIQKAEKFLNKELKKENSLDTILMGDENNHSINDLTFDEKVEMIINKKVKPVVLFFDEINRTDNAVFKELMNIILTRTINGYKLPWWVFIVAAMNPSTQNSMYATNELDPAQLDRFIKIKVREDAEEWITYAIENDYDKSIIEFITNHNRALSDEARQLEDDETPTPSPRGWSMINLVLKAKHKLDYFFSKRELLYLENDMNTIISAKVGSTVSAMYHTSLTEPSKLIVASDIFDFETKGISKEILDTIKKQSTARNSLTSKSVMKYLKINLDYISKNQQKLLELNNKLFIYLKALDSSSKLLFARNLTNAYTDKGVEIFNLVTDVIDDELLELLQTSNINEMKITGE